MLRPKRRYIARNHQSFCLGGLGHIYIVSGDLPMKSSFEYRHIYTAEVDLAHTLLESHTGVVVDQGGCKCIDSPFPTPVANQATKTGTFPPR